MNEKSPGSKRQKSARQTGSRASHGNTYTSRESTKAAPREDAPARSRSARKKSEQATAQRAGQRSRERHQNRGRRGRSKAERGKSQEAQENSKAAYHGRDARYRGAYSKRGQNQRQKPSSRTAYERLQQNLGEHNKPTGGAEAGKQGEQKQGNPNAGEGRSRDQSQFFGKAFDTDSTDQSFTLDAKGAATPPTESAQSAASVSGAEGRAMPRAAGRAANYARNAVIKQARYLQDGQRSEVKIQMEPPRLGKMKVEVALEKQNLNIRIQVKNPELREALQQNVRKLEQNLQELQVGLGETTVSDFWGDERQGSHMQDRDPDSRSDSGPLASESAQQASATGEGWIHTAETGQIDCLV